MSRRAKARTPEDAIELALSIWHTDASQHLERDQIDACVDSSVLAVGSPSDDWIEAVGRRPKEKKFFEVHLYRPTQDGRGVETSFARFLVPKDGTKSHCEVIWTAAQSGPWFPSID
jgi:uncharacterized protein YciU (UPF0263 family)